jgi:hypothetical protein
MKIRQIREHLLEILGFDIGLRVLTHCPVVQPDMRMDAKAIRKRMADLAVLGDRYVLHSK